MSESGIKWSEFNPYWRGIDSSEATDAELRKYWKSIHKMYQEDNKA